MRAAIVGTGRMGQAIAWAMGELGCDELILIDTNVDNLKTCARKVKCSTVSIPISPYNTDYSDIDSDIVISALPYHWNNKLARYCIDNNISYCDLGGNVSASNSINEYAHNKSLTIMTDLGLAPGWVNILAEHLYHELSQSKPDDYIPETIEMMVGGLPIAPDNYLKYNCTWSYDGLINEYKDSCAVLINGFNTLMSAMTGVVNVETSLGVMEAFYTSGGASHTIGTMQKRGVQNCSYKTIRYPGHCEAMNFLMRECGLNDDKLIELLKHACPPTDDFVIMKVKVDELESEKIIKCNDKFSAMQMATAFPISAVAYMIGVDGRPTQNGIKFGRGPLSYKDIPYTEFEEKLNFLFEEAK